MYLLIRVQKIYKLKARNREEFSVAGIKGFGMCFEIRPHGFLLHKTTI
jgi:hypothetical protein